MIYLRGDSDGVWMLMCMLLVHVDTGMCGSDVYGCLYMWMLVCMKMSVESCSLSVLADGYKEKAKDERGKIFPPFYFHDLHSLGTRDNAVLGERLMRLKHTERGKAGVASGWRVQALRSCLD